MRRVMKFGGSSVADVEKMKNVAKRIAQGRAKGDDIVVVVSAMGKTTNQLLAMAKEASENPSKREIDMMLATGEQVSIALLSMVLDQMGVEAVSLTGYQAGIKTAGLHTKSKIFDIDIEKVVSHLEQGKVVVVAGFQGFNEEGEITTLGRGGSDTTAVALAAKLGCQCEIYTDVDGIYGIDPRKFPGAKHLAEITYEEMKEMAFLGAKVMEPRSVDIAQHYDVVIYVASSYNEGRGTYITKGDTRMENRSITGLSLAENIISVTIRNIPQGEKNIAELFTKLAQAEINVDMISQVPMSDDRVSISFTAPLEERSTIEQVLAELVLTLAGVSVEIETDVVKISVIGTGMRTQSGVAAKIFRLFADNGISFQQVSTSEISISYTINERFKDLAVELIAQSFEL